MCAAKRAKHGAPGKPRIFQEHPFEVLMNGAGVSCARPDLDIQGLHRAIPEFLRGPEGALCPRLPVDEARAQEFGCTGHF